VGRSAQRSNTKGFNTTRRSAIDDASLLFSVRFSLIQQKEPVYEFHPIDSSDALASAAQRFYGF
jgi:hypothetical protein